MTRAAATARALAIVVVAFSPVPYLDRVKIDVGLTMEDDVVRRRAETLSFEDAMRPDGEPQEAAALVRLAGAVTALGCSALDRRRAAPPRSVPAALRPRLVVVVTVLLCLRHVEILRFGRLEPRLGSRLVDGAGALQAAALAGGLLAGTAPRDASGRVGV